MQQRELVKLLEYLIGLPNETEWVEFKVSYAVPQDIGEYISALSNSARLCDKDVSYLVFGVDNKTHKIIGTTFYPRKKKIGNEELENWLTHLLEPKIDFKIYDFEVEGEHVVIFKIDPASNIPVKFMKVSYVRVGTYKKKLDDHSEKARKIWQYEPGYDWSVQICSSATIAHLDPQAILKARKEYKKRKKNPAEIDEWNEITFLNKAKLIIDGKITRTAILLLGKSESAHFLSPNPSQISWFLRDEHNNPKDYEHFSPPFILTVEEVLSKIRNLNVRFLPPNTLFPIETTQYDVTVIREALHNCIAHQDYQKNARINVVERADEVLFENAGNFIPGSVEAVIKQDAPPKIYRNPFLAQAMVNCGMIETEGGGIKEMFKIQRERFFPLPTYELDKQDEVRVSISGKIIDENYTRFLMMKTDLDLDIVIMLDKVQKRREISKKEHRILKRLKLVEGRYPKLFIASNIALATGEKAIYIKYKSFNKKYYKDLILQLINKFGLATRRDINNLILDKLSTVLNERQKHKKISNILSEMSRKDKSIKNIGSDKNPKWVIY